MQEFLDHTRYTDLIEQVLKFAKQQGASAAEVSLNSGAGFTTTVRLGEVDVVEYHRHKSLEIKVYLDQKTGAVSTSDLRLDVLKEAVTKAINIAKFTSEDPFAGLAAKDSLAFSYPTLDLYHPWNITPEQAIALATQCEKIARAEDKRIINSEGITVNTYDSLHMNANSLGFLGYYPFSQHTISGSMIASDGHQMQRDYEYTTARDPHELLDIHVLAKQIAQRTIDRLGAEKLTTRYCPVLYSPQLARSLLGHFVGAISGGQLYRKASFLLDQLGQPVFPKYINIIEEPHLLKAMGSAPFDDDGVKTNEKEIISNGILKTYLLSSYAGRKLGMKSTGNAGSVHNVAIATTGSTFKELLQQMQTGLFVTELIGQGVNYVSGEYSRGAFGYWVENGEIQHPVHEITIAGNLRDMYKNILAVGNDIDLRGHIRSGSILIQQMAIAGQ